MSPAKPARAVSPVKRLRPATDRQGEFLEAVVALTESLGHAPSNSDVARHMGVSRWGARRQLMALEQKGLLKDIPKVVSSDQWEITDTARKVRAGR